MSLVISAPGKLVLAGEYAVLEGHPGLSMAVDRRVILKVSKQVHKSALWRAFGSKKEALFEIDSRALYFGMQKLGLGSSAAAAVCMAAYIDVEQAYELALKGHRQFCKGSGSGIDVATSYQGGLIRFQAGSVESLWPDLDQKTFTCVYTGKSKETSSLLKSVLDYKSSKPQEYQTIMREIGELTPYWERFYTGYLDWNGLSELVIQNRNLLSQLAKRAKIDLMSSEHQAIWAISRQFGGFSKPSGAGGGDIALCFVPSEARSFLEQALKEAGFKPIEFSYFCRGLELTNEL